jgi:type I restriction enzyme S subunit
MLLEFLIPIPSLSEQQRIVSILDTFTSSISNLKQQIEERRKQYEYERDLLLDLEGKEGVEMKKLGDFAEIGTGSSNTQDELESGRYPFFVRSQIVRWQDDYEFDEIAIITSGDGVGVGKVLHYYEGKYALHQRAYRIHVENDSIVPKFIFYFMQKDFYWYIMSNAYAASVTSVRRPMLINYPIPIPPLSIQSRIVSILDTFEQSISNLEEQLAMREKQYEYYRNQLLTFEGEEERGKT